jgi:probable phosphoglycerate mutase
MVANSEHGVDSKKSDDSAEANKHKHPGFIVLLRHGQTAWSVSGQHTGRTDLPLTNVGEQQARDAGERLRRTFPEGFDSAHVFVSPLHRARTTAELAGYRDYQVVPALAEWDYGRAEGRTREQVAQLHGRPWKLWVDGTEALEPALDADWTATFPDGKSYQVHNGQGETLRDVYARTSEVISKALPLVESGENVLLVAHAHVLRILSANWLGLEPDKARIFRLDTAHYSVLSQYKGDNVIERWNC